MRRSKTQSSKVRRFSGFVCIDPARESVPNYTTLFKSRRRRVTNDPSKAMFEEINAHLAKRLLEQPGTIVDAMIIAEPGSTNNASNERDPDLRQAKKGNQWHHGMKARLGIDESGIVHSLIRTGIKVNDVPQAGGLLHGEEAHAFGNA